MKDKRFELLNLLNRLDFQDKWLLDERQKIWTFELIEPFEPSRQNTFRWKTKDLNLLNILNFQDKRLLDERQKIWTFEHIDIERSLNPLRLFRGEQEFIGRY